MIVNEIAKFVNPLQAASQLLLVAELGELALVVGGCDRCVGVVYTLRHCATSSSPEPANGLLAQPIQSDRQYARKRRVSTGLRSAVQMRPARMCSVPRMCSRIRCPARRPSPLRSSATSRWCWRSSASGPGPDAGSARSGRSSGPAPRSSPARAAASAAASATPMWNRMSARRYSVEVLRAAHRLHEVVEAVELLHAGALGAPGSRRRPRSRPAGRARPSASSPRRPAVALGQRRALRHERAAPAPAGGDQVTGLHQRGEGEPQRRARDPELVGEAALRRQAACPARAARGGWPYRAAPPSPRTWSGRWTGSNTPLRAASRSMAQRYSARANRCKWRGPN